MVVTIGLQCISCCIYACVLLVLLQCALHVSIFTKFSHMHLSGCCCCCCICLKSITIIWMLLLLLLPTHIIIIWPHGTHSSYYYSTQYYISPSTNCPRLRVVSTGPPSGCNPNAGNSPDTLISVNVCGVCPVFCCSASSAVGLAIKHDCHPAVAAASISLV
jgi:hypothetical protein